MTPSAAGPSCRPRIVQIIIRELIVEGTHEGLAAARARGTRLGRPPAMTPEKIRQARALLTQPDESISSIARLLGVSRATLYKYVPEITISSLPADHRPPPGLTQYDALLSPADEVTGKDHRQA